MLGGRGARARVEDIEEDARRRLGEFTLMVTTLGLGKLTLEKPQECTRADEGAAVCEYSLNDRT